jgi:hypothetical protein
MQAPCSCAVRPHKYKAPATQDNTLCTVQLVCAHLHIIKLLLFSLCCELVVVLQHLLASALKLHTKHVMSI